MTEQPKARTVAKPVHKPVSSTAPVHAKKTLAFQPSSNWALLQKSLPSAPPSKKRKRNAKVDLTVDSPKIKIPKTKPTLTTYNPWKPQDTSHRSKGNSLLVLDSIDKNIRPGRYVAIDCEMVGIGPDGSEDLLARVSVVNYLGHVLLDAFVKPSHRVTDWRTQYSGVRPGDVLNDAAQPFEKVQQQVQEIIKDRILVGHGVQGDLTVLKLTHPKEKVRDTGLYEPFRTKYSAGKMPSLKKVVKGELDVDVQASEHDSVEDAQAAMALFRGIRTEYEKAIRMGHLNGIRPKVEGTTSVPANGEDATKGVDSSSKP